jgi:hypothetical protein
VCVEMSLLIYTPFKAHLQKKNRERNEKVRKNKKARSESFHHVVLRTYEKGLGNASFKFACQENM